MRVDRVRYSVLFGWPWGSLGILIFWNLGWLPKNFWSIHIPSHTSIISTGSRPMRREFAAVAVGFKFTDADTRNNEWTDSSTYSYQIRLVSAVSSSTKMTTGSFFGSSLKTPKRIQKAWELSLSHLVTPCPRFQGTQIYRQNPPKYLRLLHSLLPWSWLWRWFFFWHLSFGLCGFSVSNPVGTSKSCKMCLKHVPCIRIWCCKLSWLHCLRFLPLGLFLLNRLFSQTCPRRPVFVIAFMGRLWALCSWQSSRCCFAKVRDAPHAVALSVWRGHGGWTCQAWGKPSIRSIRDVCSCSPQAEEVPDSSREFGFPFQQLVPIGCSWGCGWGY